MPTSAPNRTSTPRSPYRSPSRGPAGVSHCPARQNDPQRPIPPRHSSHLLSTPNTSQAVFGWWRAHPPGPKPQPMHIGNRCDKPCVGTNVCHHKNHNLNAPRALNAKASLQTRTRISIRCRLWEPQRTFNLAHVFPKLAKADDSPCLRNNPSSSLTSRCKTLGQTVRKALRKAGRNQSV